MTYGQYQEANDQSAQTDPWENSADLLPDSSFQQIEIKGSHGRQMVFIESTAPSPRYFLLSTDGHRLYLDASSLDNKEEADAYTSYTSAQWVSLFNSEKILMLSGKYSRGGAGFGYVAETFKFLHLSGKQILPIFDFTQKLESFFHTEHDDATACDADEFFTSDFELKPPHDPWPRILIKERRGRYTQCDGPINIKIRYEEPIEMSSIWRSFRWNGSGYAEIENSEKAPILSRPTAAKLHP